MRTLAALLLLVSLAANAADATMSFRLSPEFPRYVTAHVEFRDPSGKRWPSFLYGKPETNGVLRLDNSKPTAAFVLRCDKRPQKNGNQSKRVLGEVFDTPDKGVVLVNVTSISGVTQSTDAKKPGYNATFAGTLKLGEKSVPFSAPGTLRNHAGGRGDEKNESKFGTFEMDAKGSDLGLKNEAPVHVRVGFTAYAENAGAKKLLPVK